MKFLVSVLLFFLCGTSVKLDVVNSVNTSVTSNLFPPWTVIDEQCVYSSDVTQDYRRALYEFATHVFKRIAYESGNHFIFSPLSLWLSLAAIAEGTEGIARQELFNLLNLPDDVCRRQQYYMIANRRECSGNDVTLSRKRVFIIDENLILNQVWENFICSNWLIDIITAPLKRDPLLTLNLMRKIFSVHISNLDINGNSVILDTLNYTGFWTSAFSGDIIEHVSFHNDFGEIIGSVNMMRMRKRVKLAYLPEVKLKILELPVGYDSRYRLIFGLSVGRNSIRQASETFRSEFVFKMIKNLRLSRIPLEINIPQYTATSEIDMKRILEQLGVKSLWTDPYATRNISIPSALPSGFVQRVTVKLDRPSITPYIEDSEAIVGELIHEDTGLDAEIGRDFIADRPFMFAFFDKETYSCLFISSFSTPLA